MSIISKTRTCILVASLVLTFSARAQTGTNSRTPGLDSLLKEIENTMKREHMPGLMLSIVTKDSVIYSGGLGYSDLEHTIKANSSTLFHMQSVTKMFTALAIQKLVAEGKIHLNDRLKQLAPEVVFENEWETTDPVRVIHLLEHTAGFDDVHLNSMLSRSGKPLTKIKAVEAISGSLNSRWRPGERMSYSNPDYVVLGYLIEKLSGMPWNEYVSKEVLLPLGMRKSIFDLDGKDNQAYAKGYYFTGRDYKPFRLATTGGNGAGGALVSSADDLSAFLTNLLNGWKTVKGDWLSEKSLTEMETVHSTLASHYGLQTGYALANEIFPNNRKVTFRGHNGEGEGFNSWIFYNREAGIAYSICNNGGKRMWQISQLIEAFLTKGLKQQKPQDNDEDLKRLIPLSGYYQLANPRIANRGFYEKIFNGVTVSVTNNKLVVKLQGGKSDTLVHTKGNLFRSKDDVIPSFVIGTDKSGKAFFHGYGNNFYERTSYTFIVFQKAVFLAGIAAMILSVIIVFITLLLKIFRKARWKDVFLTSLPAIAVLSLAAAYQKLKITDQLDKTAFATLNYTTIYIYLSTLGFGLFSIASVYILFIRWRSIPNRWVRALLAFNAIFIFYISCLLFYNGWIGIRIWSL
jgi:CubicO group peptidase (beta-lactamase class C family)